MTVSAGGGVGADLMQRLERRDATVGVVGLGYVGLPLAVAFAKAGMRAIGVDADAGRASLIGRGQSPIEDVTSDELAPLVRTGPLTVAGSVEGLGPADAIVICVPTPLGKSKEPDISHIVAAADEVAKILRPGQLVVFESTTYPGTTEEVLLLRFMPFYPGPGIGGHCLPSDPYYLSWRARMMGYEARLVLDTRNLTGALGPQPHVIRL